MFKYYRKPLKNKEIFVQKNAYFYVRPSSQNGKYSNTQDRFIHKNCYSNTIKARFDAEYIIAFYI